MINTIGKDERTGMCSRRGARTVMCASMGRSRAPHPVAALKSRIGGCPAAP
jgi:hypothetical protein